MNKCLIIDGDAVAYRCAAACQKQEYVTNAGDRFRCKQEAGMYRVYKGDDLVYEEVACVDGRRLKKSDAIDNFVKTTSSLGWKEDIIIEPVANAFHSLKSMMNRIQTTCGTDEGIVAFSDAKENNFRYKLATMQPYKANRTEKPKLYKDCVLFLTDNYPSKTIQYAEADDALGICLTKCPERFIAVHNDKDINQVPGDHFNFVTGERYEISERQGEFNFWKQMLTGDRADNIPGLKGIGDVKADKYLKDPDKACADFSQFVFQMYEEYYSKHVHNPETHFILQKLTEIGRLLYILREPLEWDWSNLWKYPEF